MSVGSLWTELAIALTLVCCQFLLRSLHGLINAPPVAQARTILHSEIRNGNFTIRRTTVPRKSQLTTSHVLYRQLIGKIKYSPASSMQISIPAKQTTYQVAESRTRLIAIFYRSATNVRSRPMMPNNTPDMLSGFFVKGRAGRLLGGAGRGEANRTYIGVLHANVCPSQRSRD